MHFENISLEICKQHGWSEVILPMDAGGALLLMLGELHTYKSRGRFNFDSVKHGIHNKMYVWFENKDDATYFALKYTR